MCFFVSRFASHCLFQGHLEFFLCNSEDLSDPDGVPTQGCFNMNPLTRTAGDGVNSPIDPSYPGRYYVDPECREKETVQDKPEEAAEGYVMHMTYDLPRGLICKRCILQMVYCEFCLVYTLLRYKDTRLQNNIETKFLGLILVRGARTHAQYVSTYCTSFCRLH